MRRLLAFAFWAAVALTAWFAFGPSPDGGVPGRDKLYHFVTFSTLGLLAAFAFPAASLLRLGAALLAGGVLIEAVQALPLVGRDPSLGDVVADAGGVVLALIVSGFARAAARA